MSKSFSIFMIALTLVTSRLILITKVCVMLLLHKKVILGLERFCLVRILILVLLEHLGSLQSELETLMPDLCWEPESFCLRLKKAFILARKLLKTCHVGSKIYLLSCIGN